MCQKEEKSLTFQPFICKHCILYLAMRVCDVGKVHLSNSEKFPNTNHGKQLYIVPACKFTNFL